MTDANTSQRFDIYNRWLARKLKQQTAWDNVEASPNDIGVERWVG